MDPVNGISMEHHSSSDDPVPQKPSLVKGPVKRSLQHLDDSENVKRPRTAAASKRRPSSYQRRPKPPYTYLSMAVVAIYNSPNRRLTLLGIQEAIADMFTFFRGEYTGWRDSIRHNLSANKCFVRIPRNDSRHAKGSYWTVDLTLVPRNAFQRTSTRGQRQQWAPTLILELGIKDIPLSAKQHDNQQPPMVESFTRTRPSFSIDNILGKTDTKPSLVAEPPDTKYNHPYSFMGYSQTSDYILPYAAELYQTVNAPHAFPATPLYHVPSYGETRPFSTLFADQSTYTAVATDLTMPHHSLPDVFPESTCSLPSISCNPLSEQYHQTATDNDLAQTSTVSIQPTATIYRPFQTVNYPTSSLPSASWNSLCQQPLHPETDYYATQTSTHTVPTQTSTHTVPTQTSTHTVPTQPQTSATIYRPFETESSSFFHPRSTGNQSTPSAAYDSDASSDVSLPQSSRLAYMPPPAPSVYSSDSSDACMGPPSTASLFKTRLHSWYNTHSDASSCNTYSTTASLGAAVDDLALFSDSSSSSRVSIPIPAFSEDSQSLPNMSDMISDTQVMFCDAVSNSASSIPDVIDIYHFGGSAGTTSYSDQ